MPKTRRDILKRTTAQALNDLDRCLENIQALQEVFAPAHPDYAEYLAVIANGVMQCQEFILDFWEKAWGTRPDDFQEWR